MKRLCPTIHELLAFDAVARYQSMTTAANILCISVSGISKQLSGLENYIGKPLVTKKGRGIELTPAGKEYWTKISPSLKIIESATVETMAGNSETGILTLSSAPTFLTKWLIPRLADFRRLYPSVTFSFCQHTEFNDAHNHKIDAAIRYGAGHWPNVVSDYITGREFVCIYSNELLHGESIDAPNNLIDYTLLHHEEAPTAWRKWASHHGVNETDVLSGPRFVQYSAVIQAALSGLGIGVVPRIFVEEELSEDRLRTFGNPIDVDQGHYLCFNADHLERPAFSAFRNWILAQGKPEQAQ